MGFNSERFKNNKKCCQFGWWSLSTIILLLVLAVQSIQSTMTCGNQINSYEGKKKVTDRFNLKLKNKIFITF